MYITKMGEREGHEILLLSKIAKMILNDPIDIYLGDSVCIYINVTGHARSQMVKDPVAQDLHPPGESYFFDFSLFYFLFTST